MLKKALKKISVQTAICFTVFFLVAYFVSPPVLSPGFNAILTIASFLYGFYIVYAINAAKSSHEKIITHLKGTEGVLLDVYGLFKVFDKKTQADLLKKIDEYLISTIDYYLPDYSNSTAQAIVLMNFTQEVEAKTDQEKIAQERSVEALEQMLKERVIIESEIANDITTVEWVVILLLFGIILFFIFTIDSTGGGLLLIFLKSILSTALALMIIILAKFNDLGWHEEKLIWRRLTTTFHELGLTPYYSSDAYEQYYHKKTLDYPYRVAYYSGMYPSMDGKIVKVISPKNQESTDS